MLCKLVLKSKATISGAIILYKLQGASRDKRNKKQAPTTAQCVSIVRIFLLYKVAIPSSVLVSYCDWAKYIQSRIILHRTRKYFAFVQDRFELCFGKKDSIPFTRCFTSAFLNLSATRVKCCRPPLLLYACSSKISEF